MKFTLNYFTCNLNNSKTFKFKFHCLESTTAWKAKKVQNNKLLFGRITYRRIHYVFTQKSTSICLDILAFGLTNNSYVGRIRINSVWTIQLFVRTKLFFFFGRISFLFGRITFFWRRGWKPSDSNEKSLY